MRGLALVVLMSLAADARTGRFERVNSRTPQGRSERGFLGDSLAFLEFAPSSGAGLPSAGNLCDQLTAGEKVGSWWCLNGDGTMASGSQVTLSAAGSPLAVTGTQCPSGPNCTAYSAQGIYSASNYYTTGNVASPAADMTVCALLQVTDASANAIHVGRLNATTYSYQLWTSSSTARLDVYKTNGSSTQTNSAAGVTAGAIHLICGTYDFVADGSSLQRTYLDGTGGTASTTAVGPIQAQTEETRVGRREFDALITNGNILGVFFTETALDATAMARIARAVLADAPTGARGEALTLTRSAPQFCESSDGTGSLLPANRLCVTRGGTTAAQGSFLQSLLQTEALGNAAWADVATPTITSDSTVSAGGTLTADTVDDNNAAAFEGRSQTVTVTAAAAYTMSCYAKAGTLAKIRLSLDGTTGDTTALSSSSWTRVSVTDVSTSGVSVSAQVLAGTATTDTGTVIVWGCNVTPGSSVRPYIPATSAGVITGAEVPYLTLTNAPALNSMEATADTPATYAATARVMSVHKDATNAFDMYVDTTAANKLNCLATVGGVTYSGLSSGAVSASATHRLSCSYDGTNVIACVDGTCNSTARAFAMFSAATRVYVGTYATTGAEVNPTLVIKGVKADPLATRFR